MTHDIKCDACHQLCNYNYDYFRLRGKTFDDGTQLAYWEGEICFDCQRKMRDCVGVK